MILVDHTPQTGDTVVASALGTPHPQSQDETANALFREAKRRERRRRLTTLAIVAVVLGGTGLAYALSRGEAPPGPRHTASSRSASPPIVPPAVGRPLEHPYGLAVARNGDLYIVDVAREQVLRRLPSGKLQVVAGDGRRGFSGDGGPAPDAELNLAPPSGIAMAKDGTLYIADSDNDRVRAVLPDGTIETAAGDGSSGGDSGLIRRATPALDASFGAPSGLAIGPDGDLYIAAGNVVRLTPSGLIEWVAGIPGAFACGFGIYCNPAGQADFIDPDQLAFDGAGDLFVSDSNGFGLYEIANDGRLAYLGQFRGDGDAGALAAAPDGTVVEAGRLGLARLPANGRINLSKRPTQLPRAPGEAVPGDLDHTLGHNKQFVGGYNIFVAGDGLAVGPNGTVYLDTNTGNTVTSVSALVEVEPNGGVLTLWKS
jgi:hypothetical protein